MARKVARQIQPAIPRSQRSDSATSTSDDGRTTERITTRTVARMKRRIPPKPAPQTFRVKKQAVVVKRVKVIVEEPPNAVPFQQIVVGEREGEPHYRNTSNQGEDRQPGDGTSGLQQAGPSTDTNHRDPDAVEEPPFVPEPLPEGAHRLSIERLHEVLSGIDDIGQYDGHIRSEIADIGRLIMDIRRKETEMAQKMRDAYRTRTALEKVYVSRVKFEPWLIGQGKREREGEVQPEVAEEQQREEALAKEKCRTDDSEAAAAAENEEERATPRAKRARSQ